MKQSLSQKQSQSLTMTPNMQQAIKLLQLPSQELVTEIQNQLDSNIMLELEDESLSEESPKILNESEFRQSEQIADGVKFSEETSSNESESIKIDDPNGLESTDDYAEYENQSYEYNITDWDKVDVSSKAKKKNGDVRIDLSEQDHIAQNLSLRDLLTEQLELSDLSDEYKPVGLALIDYVNADGFLMSSLEEIKLAVRHGLDRDVEIDVLEYVLKVLQDFDPPGVFARNIGECLLKQLQNIGDDERGKAAAELCCRHHLEDIRKGDFGAISQKLNEENLLLEEGLRLLKSLNPRPGAQFFDHAKTYVKPDIFVKKINGNWIVEPNYELIPKLKINDEYRKLATCTSDNSEKEVLREHLKEANWFMKSLKERSDTVLDVAKAIVNMQSDFLEEGEEKMKPMILHDVAQIVGRHESTISRATHGKFMETPRGVFELKFFFDSHVQTRDGGEASSVVIRAHIRKMIAAEDSKNPLSDKKLSELLSDKGFKVARRTVAKYRISLAIPSSNDRKQKGLLHSW